MVKVGVQRMLLTASCLVLQGMRDSLEHAYDSLSKGLNTAAHTIIAIPIQELERGGAKGSVKAVIRALPIAIVKPVAGATEALSFTLLGARNLVDPDARRNWADLWECGK
jgi:autophagy-related protein 2